MSIEKIIRLTFFILTGVFYLLMIPYWWFFEIITNGTLKLALNNWLLFYLFASALILIFGSLLHAFSIKIGLNMIKIGAVMGWIYIILSSSKWLTDFLDDLPLLWVSDLALKCGLILLQLATTIILFRKGKGEPQNKSWVNDSN